MACSQNGPGRNGGSGVFQVMFVGTIQCTHLHIICFLLCSDDDTFESGCHFITYYFPGRDQRQGGGVDAAQVKRERRRGGDAKRHQESTADNSEGGR